MEGLWKAFHVKLLQENHDYLCISVLLTFIRPNSNWKTFGLVALANTAGNSLVAGSTFRGDGLLSYYFTVMSK